MVRTGPAIKTRAFAQNAESAADSTALPAETLLRAQEEERRRIAREVHDDLGQRLASLASESAVIARDAANHPLGARLTALSQGLTELGLDLRKICADIHPSTVEDLGLVAALRALSADLAQRERMRIGFTHTGGDLLAPSTAICLYRIAQEAVRNAVRHSGSREVLISLQVRTKSARLVVRDTGCGFVPADVRARSTKGGLGLISMEERARLAGGELVLESTPGVGTRIEVLVPL